MVINRITIDFSLTTVKMHTLFVDPPVMLFDLEIHLFMCSFSAM